MSILPVYRFTVDEYHRMVRAGVLTEDHNVELLEGWIVPKMSRYAPHDGTIEAGEELIRPLLPKGWRLRIQSAVTTADSEPEPDFAIVRGMAPFFTRHPTAAETDVVMEVSDTTLDRDRNDKGPIYSRAGIRCYWIINIPDRQIEVYTDPTGPNPNPRYRQHQDFRPGDSVPLSIAGQPCGTIAVDDFLPRP